METETQWLEFSDELLDNVTYLQTIMGESSDFVIRSLTLPGNLPIALFYLDGMVDKQALQDSLIQCLHERLPSLSLNFTMTSIMENVLNSSEVLLMTSVPEALDLMLSGSVILLMEGTKESIVVPLQGWEERSISESKTQSVVRGP